MRNTTALRGFTALGTVVLLLGAVGCCDVCPPPPPPKAIAAVVEDAYGRLGGAASVFLGAAADVEDTTMARVRSTLGDDLASTFQPPSARISGDPGASIVLGRFNVEEDGRLSVVASYVQEDGTGRGCTRYALDREGDDWIVVGTTDAWPDCPISTQGEESYHDALERAWSGECLGLWTNVGTCGEWLYVAEGLGHGRNGPISHFDRFTGLIVARQLCTGSDVAETSGQCHFVFGVAECEAEITETILCDR